MAAVHLAVLLFPLALIAAATQDVMTRRIPNLLILVMVLVFPFFAYWIGMPWWMALEHSATAAVLLLAGFTLFSFRCIGAGDAKLLAASGLWLGLAPSVLFVAFAALSGGVLAVAIGLWHVLHMETALKSERAGNFLNGLWPDVPYGFALAAGAILALPYSWMMPPSLG